MKIIGTDNLNRDEVKDRLFMEGVNESDVPFAIRVCESLNDMLCHDHGGTFYKIVPDDYRLSRGMEDLV